MVRKRLVGLSLVGVLGFCTIALAQEGPNVSVNIMNHAVTKIPAAGGSGIDSDGQPARPASAATTSSAPADLGALTTTTTTTTTDSGRPGRRRLPKAGGDPLTIAAAGSVLVALGYKVRRRR